MAVQGPRYQTVQACDPKLLNLKRPPGRTKAVQCSMSHEVAWRLQKLASLMDVGPGQLVEALIAPTVLGVRLPYDSYGRASIPSTSESVGGMEGQEGQENGAGETLPIAEGMHVPPIGDVSIGPGAGEGGEKPPAPSARKRRTG